MSTKVLMGVDEYLRTSFEGPDCEYLDGEVVERNMGEMAHADVQYTLGRYGHSGSAMGFASCRKSGFKSAPPAIASPTSPYGEAGTSAIASLRSHLSSPLRFCRLKT